MARPTTKPDLLKAANAQFDRLWTMIDSMPEGAQDADFNFDAVFLQKQKEAHWRRDKNLRDVLIHLYEWHRLLLDWEKANRNGAGKPFLPIPYNWKTYGRMNEMFWEKHQGTPLCDAAAMVKKSHADVLAMIEEYSNDELFAKGALAWTGTSPLGSYCVSATASHYEWAIKKMKAYMKTYTGLQ